MRRFAVRQRPLQPGKRIRIYHLAVDGSFINENGDRVAANAYELDDCVSVVLNGHLASPKRATQDPLVANAFPLRRKAFFAKKRVCHSAGLQRDSNRCVVAGENVVSDQGAHLHPEAAYSHHSQL